MIINVQREIKRELSIATKQLKAATKAYQKSSINNNQYVAKEDIDQLLMNMKHGLSVIRTSLGGLVLDANYLVAPIQDIINNTHEIRKRVLLWETLEYHNGDADDHGDDEYLEKMIGELKNIEKQLTYCKGLCLQVGGEF